MHVSCQILIFSRYMPRKTGFLKLIILKKIATEQGNFVSASGGFLHSGVQVLTWLLYFLSSCRLFLTKRIGVVGRWGRAGDQAIMLEWLTITVSNNSHSHLLNRDRMLHCGSELGSHTRWVSILAPSLNNCVINSTYIFLALQSERIWCHDFFIGNIGYQTQ